MTPRLLAAEQLPNGLRYAHDWFNRSDPTIFITIISTFAVLGVGLLIAALWQHIQELRLSPEKRQPMVLFRQLQKRLGLSYVERWRMWWLARRTAHEHPAALLISEVRFDACIVEAGYAPAGQAVGVVKFQRIRAKLFAA